MIIIIIILSDARAHTLTHTDAHVHALSVGTHARTSRVDYTRARTHTDWVVGRIDGRSHDDTRYAGDDRSISRFVLLNANGQRRRRARARDPPANGSLLYRGPKTRPTYKTILLSFAASVNNYLRRQWSV